MAPDRHQLRVIRRAMEGDAEAFAGLCHRYTDALYRYLYFRLGSVLATEEVCAQVFVRAWEVLSSDPRQDVMPFRSWLFLIANDVIVERNSRFARAGLHPAAPPLMAWSDNSRKNDRSPLYPRFLAQATMQLDEVSQQVILLRFVLHLSHRETGLVIGDTSAGSRVLQYRALLEVREKLTRKRMSDYAYASDYVGTATFCLDRIISGRWNVENCLEHIPRDSERLEQILKFAVLVRDAVAIEPRRAFGKELRQQLPTEFRHSQRKPVKQPQLWRWFLAVSERIPAPVVAAFLLAVILFAGATGARAAAMAVDNAAPGDRLYELDLRLERAYRGLLTNPETQFEVALRATEERLAEAEKLARRGDSGGLQVALVAYSVEVAALANLEMYAAPVSGVNNLDVHFAKQQQELDKIYSLALTSYAANENTETPRVVCEWQDGNDRQWHPMALSLATQHGVDYAELIKWVCDGHSFGEIVLALASVKMGQVETVEIMQLKSELGGWGELWHEIGGERTVMPTEDDGAEGSAVPGADVKKQETGAEATSGPVVATPEPTATPTSVISPTATAMPVNAAHDDNQGQGRPESDGQLGPPAWVDPPGGGPPPHAGPPDGEPPNDPGPPEWVDPPGGSPPGQEGNLGNSGNPGNGSNPNSSGGNPDNSGNAGGGRP